MRECTHMLIGVGNCVILLACFIGFSIFPVAIFGDEKTIDAGATVGGIAGLLIAIGMIIAIDKIYGRSRTR
jgi:hypothetical protein